MKSFKEVLTHYDRGSGSYSYHTQRRLILIMVSKRPDMLIREHSN